MWKILEKNIGLVKWGSLTLFILIHFAFTQNIDLYLSLLKEGRTKEVITNLEMLETRFPNDPGVIYLKGLTSLNGEQSLELFQTIVDKYPNSNFTDDAKVKIGEYLYSRGLYSQASTVFKSIPAEYPKSDLLQRSINLMAKSYMATGEVDSARYYLSKFKKIYPGLDYSHLNIPPVENNKSLVKINTKEALNRLNKKSEKKEPEKIIPKPWVIQVGAFSRYDNAKRIQKNLEQNGYNAGIEAVMSNGRRLHVVRVFRYPTRSEAENTAKELVTKFGLEYRILNRPKL